MAKLNFSQTILPRREPIQYPRDLAARNNGDSFSKLVAYGYCCLMLSIKLVSTGQVAQLNVAPSSPRPIFCRISELPRSRIVEGPIRKREIVIPTLPDSIKHLGEINFTKRSGVKPNIELVSLYMRKTFSISSFYKSRDFKQTGKIGSLKLHIEATAMKKIKPTKTLFIFRI